MNFPELFPMKFKQGDDKRRISSSLEDVDGETSSNNNVSDDISISLKKVPPDPYDRDNPGSSHCKVDDANLCNDRVEQVDIIVHSRHIAGAFGISYNPLDKDVIFNAGSKQLKVTTNSELNAAAALSICTGDQRAQDAVFHFDDPDFIVSAARLRGNGDAPTHNNTYEDDNPPIDDATDYVPDSILSLFDDVEQTLDASIAELLRIQLKDSATTTMTGVVVARRQRLK